MFCSIFVTKYKHNLNNLNNKHNDDGDDDDGNALSVLKMNLTHCKNSEIFSRLHTRNLCLQQCIRSTILF